MDPLALSLNSLHDTLSAACSLTGALGVALAIAAAAATAAAIVSGRPRLLAAGFLGWLIGAILGLSLLFQMNWVPAAIAAAALPFAAAVGVGIRMLFFTRPLAASRVEAASRGTLPA